MTCDAALDWLLATLSRIAGLSSPWSFAVGVAATLLVLWWIFRRRTAAQSVSIGLPFGLGSATFDLSRKDRAAAWKLHIQLVTRKAALPFDQTHDVIADVLSSLYDLFHVARELLLEMPPANSNDQHGVANLIVRVLNSGIRPTLTRWHADYRRWWEAALARPDNAARSPQDIQLDYPRYQELIQDLAHMNTELSKFSDQLVLVASGESPRKIAKSAVAPAAPELAPPAERQSAGPDENPPPSEPNTA